MKPPKRSQPVPWRQLIVVNATGDVERQTALLAAHVAPGARVLLPSGKEVGPEDVIDWRGCGANALVTPPTGYDERGDWAPLSDVGSEIIHRKEDS